MAIVEAGGYVLAALHAFGKKKEWAFAAAEGEKAEKDLDAPLFLKALEKAYPGKTVVVGMDSNLKVNSHPHALAHSGTRPHALAYSCIA